MTYSPPNTHYTQLYGLFENEDMFKFIGKNGAHFKYLTEKLGVEYIWWNKENNIIEIWGPERKLFRAKEIMQIKLDAFMTNKQLHVLQRQNAATTKELNEYCAGLSI